MRCVRGKVLALAGLLGACEGGELTIDLPGHDVVPAGDTDRLVGGDTASPGETDAPAGPGDSDPPDGPEPFELRVLTINLRTPLNNPWNVDARLDIVASTIKTLNVDLVALQEVSETSISDNTAARLAERTGFHHASVMGTDWGLYREGPGVLTRWKPTWVEERSLPHKDLINTATRKVIGVGVPTPAGEVAFLSTHLGLQNDDDAHADQAVEAWKLLDARRGDAPAFLGGDLNAEPGRKTVRVLVGDAQHGGVRGDLVDAWAAVGTGPGRTYPAERPDRRIDYVFSGDGAGWTATPLQCQVVMGQAVGGTWASDHRGVLCRFQIAPR